MRQKTYTTSRNFSVSNFTALDKHPKETATFLKRKNKCSSDNGRYETYLIPGETLIAGGRGEGEAFHPGIGYASYLFYI